MHYQQLNVLGKMMLIREEQTFLLKFLFLLLTTNVTKSTDLVILEGLDGVY